MASAPVDQTVRTDGIARFVCVGIGSFISISWEYHEVCGSDGGNCEASEVVNEEKMQINSTLTINTSMLGLQLGRNYSIQCILHQSVPGLQGENQTVSTRLVVTPTGNAMTMMSASFCYCRYVISSVRAAVHSKRKDLLNSYGCPKQLLPCFYASAMR